MLELRVHPEDIGKVIGKEGRIAKAIRILLGAAGMKLKKRYTLEILEERSAPVISRHFSDLRASEAFAN